MTIRRATGWFALVAAAAISLAALPRDAAAQQKWDEVVAAAKKEGELNIKGAPGSVYQETLTEGFKKKYPEINVTYTGLQGFESIPRIMRERASGLYAWDVYIGGTPSILDTLKPAGAFAPLRPALMQPGILDDSAWFGGFDFGWQDNEKQLAFAFDFTVSAGMYVNWDFVKRDDLKTIKDLLKPQFANKIVWDDPRQGGAGIASGVGFLLNFGENFLAQLIREQKIVYANNGRQIAEWVVRGQYPIGIAAGSQHLEQFWRSGVGKNVDPFNGDMTKLVGGPGFGAVALMDRAPHPNAATVYINWLLSKEGQMDYVKSGRNSRRLDVPPADPALAGKPGVAYEDSQSESKIPLRAKVSAISKENIKQ
jgi:iron(III) transport system substrate-binding protein